MLLIDQYFDLNYHIRVQKIGMKTKSFDLNWVFSEQKFIVKKVFLLQLSPVKLCETLGNFATKVSMKLNKISK